MAIITPGKSALSLVALVTIIAPYLADWSKTHVFNPNWPPHARFHNGQTMSTGLFLGFATLYYLYRPAPTYLQPTHLNFALLLLHCYYVPALSASLYPGALWVDPEFGEGRPQLYVFLFLLHVAWVGWAFEKKRLRDASREKRRE